MVIKSIYGNIAAWKKKELIKNSYLHQSKEPINNKIMGTEFTKPIDKAKAKIELVATKSNFSKKMNETLKRVKVKKLNNKEIKEISIESYAYTF